MQPDALHKTRVALDDCRFRIQFTFARVVAFSPILPMQNRELVTGRIITRNARAGSRHVLLPLWIPCRAFSRQVRAPGRRAKVAASCSAAPRRFGGKTRQLTTHVRAGKPVSNQRP
jgi:hypothetical protein